MKRAVEELPAYYYIIYMCPHTYYMCVLILQEWCINIFLGKKKICTAYTLCVFTMASYHYISVCPAGELYVSSYY